MVLKCCNPFQIVTHGTVMNDLRQATDSQVATLSRQGVEWMTSTIYLCQTCREETNKLGNDVTFQVHVKQLLLKQKKLRRLLDIFHNLK